MLTRRSMLLTPLAASLARVATAQSADPGKMLLAMHQNTSSGAGLRGALEGWSRAGIRYVELGSPQLQAFLENDTLPAARRLLEDLDLTPVSAAVVLQDIWLPGPRRGPSRWRHGGAAAISSPTWACSGSTRRRSPAGRSPPTTSRRRRTASAKRATSRPSTA